MKSKSEKSFSEYFDWRVIALCIGSLFIISVLLGISYVYTGYPDINVTYYILIIWLISGALLTLLFFFEKILINLFKKDLKLKVNFFERLHVRLILSLAFSCIAYLLVFEDTTSTLASIFFICVAIYLIVDILKSAGGLIHNIFIYIGKFLAPFLKLLAILIVVFFLFQIFGGFYLSIPAAIIIGALIIASAIEKNK
jgi:hypothetical protein